MAKLRIKISGCMRSMAGAQNFCAIRSYLATAAKHGIGMLDALTRAASGAAWVPGTADNGASVRGFTAPPRARRPMNPSSWACLTGVRETTRAEDHLRPTITPREFQR
jgi:hypothetical protein